MKKSKIYVLLTLILTLILGLSHKSSFSIDDKVYAQSYVDNFYFPYYEVQLDVRDDNSFLITERVTVHYYQAYEEDGHLVGRHKGWVRALPTWANVSRVVGDDTKPTKTYYEFDISNLKCTQGKLYDHYTDENYYYIEFGGNNYVNIDGDYEEEYVFSYEYKIGYDYLTEIDELYFNLHGTEHYTRVNAFKFTINMPHEFDESKINFYSGRYGQSDTPANIRYEVKGNTISNQVAFDAKENGERDHGVPRFLAGQGLTIRCELPNGYFTSVNSGVYEGIWINLVGIILSVICTIAVIVLCIIKGGKDRPVVTVEFYPPVGITPTDATYIAGGKINGNKMTSLILYWASQGVLKINLDSDNKPTSLTKVTNLPGSAKNYEKEIFDQMFLGSTTYYLDKYDPLLARKFHNGANDIKNVIGDRYSSKSKRNTFLIGLVAWLPLLWLNILTQIIRSGGEFMGQLMFANVVILIMYASAWAVRRKIINCHTPKSKFWWIVLNWVILALFVWVNTWLIDAYLDPWGLRYYVAISLVVFMIFCVDVFGKGFGVLVIHDSIRETYGKLIGFKNNIVKVEEEKMKLLLEKDPSYFYNILPYAYAFDVTDEFVKNFEGMAVLPNEYYSGASIYYMHYMTRSLTHSVRRSLTPPSSSGGSRGGSSGGGGGFSGGGSGGGGSFGR